jgi:predicted RNA-binding Zn-ribbon protein involved in translation (DUF1610 family)
MAVIDMKNIPTVCVQCAGSLARDLHEPIFRCTNCGLPYDAREERPRHVRDYVAKQRVKQVRNDEFWIKDVKKPDENQDSRFHGKAKSTPPIGHKPTSNKVHVGKPHKHDKDTPSSNATNATNAA